MANGRKNYFRHSFFAHNNIKLKLLRDGVGVGYYFYYFSLIELCGSDSADEFKSSFVFHESVIRSLWGVNLKKSESIANRMHRVGLLVFEKRPKIFYFEVPNLSKYLGKYTFKMESNTPKESKVKESKVKESKVKESKVKESKVKESKKEKVPTVFFNGLPKEIENWIVNIPDFKRQEWINIYGNDLIRQEIEKAYLWDLDQPKNKKKKNITRFIDGWFGRSNEMKIIKADNKLIKALTTEFKSDEC